jgi:hypothetical protein
LRSTENECPPPNPGKIAKIGEIQSDGAIKCETDSSQGESQGESLGEKFKSISSGWTPAKTAAVVAVGGVALVLVGASLGVDFAVAMMALPGLMTTGEIAEIASMPASLAGVTLL